MARNDEKSKQPEKKSDLPFPGADRKVLMVFSEDQFYNDLNVPIYGKGKVHEIKEERIGYIQRWLDRGGVILNEKEAAEYEKKKEVVPASAPDIKVKQPEAPVMGNADLVKKDEHEKTLMDDSEKNEIEL